MLGFYPLYMKVRKVKDPQKELILLFSCSSFIFVIECFQRSSTGKEQDMLSVLLWPQKIPRSKQLSHRCIGLS